METPTRVPSNKSLPRKTTSGIFRVRVLVIPIRAPSSAESNQARNACLPKPNCPKLKPAWVQIL